MATCKSTTPAERPFSGVVDDERLRWMVENDYRRSPIALHVSSDMTRAAWTSQSVWLDLARAEAVGRALLEAAERQREHDASVAWTALTTKQGGVA